MAEASPVPTHGGDRRANVWQRAKLAFPYVLLIAGALGVIASIWAAVDARMKAEENYAVMRASERADSAARSFEQFAMRTLAAAEMITQMAAVSMAHNGPDETIRRIEAAGLLDSQMFRSLGVIDDRGQVISSTSPGVSSGNHSSLPYFREARNSKNDEIIVGAPVGSRLTNLAAIPIVRRLLKPDGSFGGIIILQIKPQAFAGGYEAFRLRGRDYVALIGADGVARVGSVGAHQIAGHEFTESNVMARQKSTPNDVFFDKGGQSKANHFVAYRTLPEHSLVAAFGTDFSIYEDELANRFHGLTDVRNKSSLLVAFLALMLALVLFKKDTANWRLRTKETELHTIATSDFLTGLPNRAALESTQSVELRRADVIGFEVACLFIDLDDLGAINSTLGHSMGDEVIKAVARAIETIIEPIGQVARIGGDEFVAAFRIAGESETEALAIAEEISAAIANLSFVDGQRIEVRASIGVSLYPKHANSFADLVRCADAAMACSKVGHRGVPHVFSPDMHISIAKRLVMRTELAQAIENNQLEVFYQPKLDLASGRPIGMEALVRWRHPLRGLMSPHEFLQVAEESGLMIQIGAWVLKQASKDCKKLMRSGYSHFSVAVNISPLQFRQQELVEVVRAALRDSRLPASRLELELTESMIADKPELVIGRLENLKKLGVSIALDDFGTGYSNLQYLQRFPIDALKIDRSFVSGVPDDEHSTSIVLAIIGLARSLNLKVVAEGVETLEQQQFLQANACDAAQGFRYSRPMPFDEFKEWLRTQVKPENAPEDVIVAFPAYRGNA
jgi:diguanylate cyclase (GGDEF)-like protein